MSETVYEKRTRVVKNMRDMIDKAENDGNRSMTAEETGAYQKMEAEFEGYTATIDAQKKQAEMEAALAKPINIPVVGDPGGNAGNGRPAPEAILSSYGRALCANVDQLSNASSFTDEDKRILKNVLEQGADPSGGYLVPPEEFVRALIQKVDDLLWIRSRATTLQLTQAKSMGVPSLDTDPADADWTPEIGTIQEDTALAFGKRELKPELLSKLIKVSMRLLDTGAIPVEQLVINRLAYKFAVTEEKAYLTGTGSSQPLGLFTASPNGISTARDFVGGTTTAITADGLIDVKFSLKGAYWQNSEWLFHRDAMKQIAKLKSTTNEYIFRESMRAGEPDMLLGRPIMMSEYAPNTFTAGLYAGLFGDFSNYWIVDALSMSMQRLVEKYAGNNQIGFIGRKETDGMPVLEEAFSRVTMAAA